MSDKNEPIDDITIAINETVDGMRLVDMSKDDMIYYATKQYLKDIDPDMGYDIRLIKAELIQIIHQLLQKHNKLKTSAKWKENETLYPQQIALIIKHLYHVVRINMGGAETEFNSKYALLAIYQEFGDNRGIYIADEESLKAIVRKYNKNISDPEIKQVLGHLEGMCEVVNRCNEPDLIALDNGIFDFKTKQCLPFSPEYIFTAKCKVPYNPAATNPVIHNDKDGTDWDVESWMSNLFEDDPEVVETLWQIIGATIRPNVPWNKAAWLLSTRGNNGKGTLCELIRNLVGRASYASIKLTDFAKDFMLEPLIHATAIITDENDVGLYIAQAANLKAIITGNTIQINRKFMSAISYKFRGFMIQCVNEVPKIRDRSESFYRRQLIIKFKKSYTGIERKYIKEDYLQRKDVLEYVLYRVLHMDYYEISEPESCKREMDLYKVHNDPVRDFMNEVIPQITVEALPNKYLYALYGKWLEQNNPAAKKFMLGKTNFIAEMKELIQNFPEWHFPESHFRIKNYINGQEMTLMLYDMKEWMRTPDSNDPDEKYKLKWSSPLMSGMLKSKYKNPLPGRKPKKNNNESEK